MPKEKQTNTVKSVLTYEVHPEQVENALIKGVIAGFALMKDAIILDAQSLPDIINRQTFCLLTGLSPSQYHQLISKGIIKCKTRSTGQKVAYDVSREEFINYYQSTKTNKQYELFR